MSKVINRMLLTSLFFVTVFLFLQMDLKDKPEALFQREGYQTLSLPPLRSSDPIELTQLAIHFPDDIKTVIPEKESIVITDEHPLREPEYTNRMIFISSAIRHGEKSYFFKSSDDGRIKELSLSKRTVVWSFVSEEEDFYLLKNNETLWKVRKE